MMTPGDLELLLDPGATICMILDKVSACPRILSATGARKWISRDFQIEIQDGDVMSFRSERSGYGMCERVHNRIVTRYTINQFGNEAVRQMSHLSPSDLVRALGQWDSIGPWLDSLAVMMAEPEPNPVTDLEAEGYLQARLAEARLR